MEELRDPWLVAAWPGMGHVAHGAARFLAEQLGVRQAAEVRPEAYFDLARVEAHDGILVPQPLPRTVLGAWRNPGSGRDLGVLLGERQPTSGYGRFSREVVGLARELGFVRVFTFAAMATPTRPEAPARVFGAATDASILEELREAGVEPLREGEISGLNGTFLATAAAEGLPGACLLGEFPYFASTVANPKASAAVLAAFARISGVELELDDLERRGEEIGHQLAAHLEQLEQAAREAGLPIQGSAEGAAPSLHEEAPEEGGGGLPPEDAARVEELFREAEADRSQALRLKAELDRLGVFEPFEDRFLDLFKRAE